METVAIDVTKFQTFRHVKSSNIVGVSYDSTKKELRVLFTSKSFYKYSSVPVEVYDGLMAADSIGSFFHKNVKTKFQNVKEGDVKTFYACVELGKNILITDIDEDRGYLLIDAEKIIHAKVVEEIVETDLEKL